MNDNLLDAMVAAFEMQPAAEKSAEIRAWLQSALQMLSDESIVGLWRSLSGAARQEIVFAHIMDLRAPSDRAYLGKPEIKTSDSPRKPSTRANPWTVSVDRMSKEICSYLARKGLTDFDRVSPTIIGQVEKFFQGGDRTKRARNQIHCLLRDMVSDGRLTRTRNLSGLFVYSVKE